MSNKLIKAYPRFLNSDIQYCKTGAPPTRSSDWDPTYFITGQTGVFFFTKMEYSEHERTQRMLFPGPSSGNY